MYHIRGIYKTNFDTPPRLSVINNLMPNKARFNMTTFNSLPDNALLRIDSIIGNPKRGIIGVFPVSRSAWYAGVKNGIYPKPTNINGSKSVAWRVGDIRALLDSQNQAA